MIIHCVTIPSLRVSSLICSDFETSVVLVISIAYLLMCLKNFGSPESVIAENYERPELKSPEVILMSNFVVSDFIILFWSMPTTHCRA